MADLQLVKVGTTTIVPTDTSPKNVSFSGAPIKTSSAYPVATISETRLGNELGARVVIKDALSLDIHFKVDPLPAGEEIVVSWYVFDIENLGDDIKELLFRAQLILGYLGENVIQGNVSIDGQGNFSQYYVRVFDTKTNADAATTNLVDPELNGLETGELTRFRFTQTIARPENERSAMKRVVIVKAAPSTYGVN